jgi:hypothetical protein
MGCYPVFACRDWHALRNDFTEIGSGLVSAVLVTDPFGDFGEEELRQTFPDMMSAYKQHHIVDLTRPLREFVNADHRRKAKKALQHVTVER